jgi:hypothetical protein
MISSVEFPGQLKNAVAVMSPQRVRHLRALTGSADDLEVRYANSFLLLLRGDYLKKAQACCH